MLRIKEAISLNLNPDIVFSYLRMNRKLSQLIYVPISRPETFHSLLNLPGISWDFFVKAGEYRQYYMYAYRMKESYE